MQAEFTFSSQIFHKNSLLVCFFIPVQKWWELTDMQPLADKHLATIETSVADNRFQLKLEGAIIQRLWRRNRGKHTQDAVGVSKDRRRPQAGCARHIVLWGRVCRLESREVWT